ncbi:MAG: sulfatase, partial [Acidobacteria bacterium]|nr:sulfatase [Acidobacteriota bacterium]
MTRVVRIPVRELLAVATSLFWGMGVIGCSLPGSAPRRTTGPNIILITVESLRVDRVGCYTGDESSLTPSIDLLAERGTRFERAYTASPSTVPAVASLMTGLNPRGHGLHDDIGGRIREGVPTVASVLKEAGYRTGAVIATTLLDSDRGLDRGFDLYDDTFRAPSHVGPVKAVERPAEEGLQIALEFLDAKEEDRPFFLWLDFHDPHYDHVAPIESEGSDDPYAAEVAHVDTQIGALHEALDARGLLGQTYIALVGTHGEGLEDQGEIGHGIYLHETTIRVPFLIAPPVTPESVTPVDGEAKEEQADRLVAASEESGEPVPGRIIDRVVGLIDLAPTLLHLAGERLPGELDGHSLHDLIESDREPHGDDRNADDPVPGGESRRYFIEAMQPHAAYGWSPLFAVVEGERKVVVGPRLEAFDLEADAAGIKALAEPPGWADGLARWGRERLGPAEEERPDRRALQAAVEGLSLPWGNSPICLEKIDFPDPRDFVSLNGPLFRATTLYDQGLRGQAWPLMEEILKEDASNYRALLISIQSARASWMLDREEERMQVLQCNYPFRDEPYHTLAHGLINTGDLEQA